MLLSSPSHPIMSVHHLATLFLGRLKNEALDVIKVLGDPVTKHQLALLRNTLDSARFACEEAWSEVGRSDRASYQTDADHALEEASDVYNSTVRLLAHRAANPAAGDQPRPSPPPSAKPPPAPPPSTPPCWLCAAPHAIESCPTFLGMSLPERSATVARVGVCWRCLQLTIPRHRSIACPSSVGCDVCAKAHHVLVHGAPTAFPAAEQQAEKQVSNTTPPVIISVILEELPHNPSSVTITELIEDREPQPYRQAAPQRVDRAERTVPQSSVAPGARAARILAVHAKVGLLALTAPPQHE